MQAWRGLLGSWSEIVLVCLFITGLRLQCMALHIVYVNYWHVPLMVARRRTQRIEDNSMLENESRASAPERFTSLADPRERVLGMRHIMHLRIPSNSMVAV